MTSNVGCDGCDGWLAVGGSQSAYRHSSFRLLRRGQEVMSQAVYRDRFHESGTLGYCALNPDSRRHHFGDEKVLFVRGVVTKQKQTAKRKNKINTNTVS